MCHIGKVENYCVYFIEPQADPTVGISQKISHNHHHHRHHHYQFITIIIINYCCIIIIIECTSLKEFSNDYVRFISFTCLDLVAVSNLCTSVSSTFINYQALQCYTCLLYTSPSPRDGLLSRMPSSA